MISGLKTEEYADRLKEGAGDDNVEGDAPPGRHGHGIQGSYRLGPGRPGGGFYDGR